MTVVQRARMGLSTRYGRALVAISTVAGVLLGSTQVSNAATVSGAFTSAQASLITDIGLGVAVIIAVLLAGLGVGLLVKFARKAVRAA